MADYAPKLEQRESLTRRERRIIDRTLGVDEQLVLVTRPDPTILKVELYIHFGIAAFILISSEGEPFLLPFIILLCLLPRFRKYLKRRTLYLVPNRRCIILTPRLLPGMKGKSYPLEPNRIKEYEVFSGGIGNIVFDYNDGVRGATSHDDDRIPEGFLDLPQCNRVVTLIRKQIKKLHQLDHLPPAPQPKEEPFADTDGLFVPFAEQIQDRMKEIKVQKEQD
ncbi:MAG: hypothetical protein IIV41_02565 [Akkermansia sp.]|nr:hypothetical protein [Akkermansia sp.]